MLNAFLQSAGMAAPNFAPEMSGGPAVMQFGASSQTPAQMTAASPSYSQTSAAPSYSPAATSAYQSYPAQMQQAFQPQLQPFMGATTAPAPTMRQPMNWMTTPAARFGYGMYSPFGRGAQSAYQPQQFGGYGSQFDGLGSPFGGSAYF